MIEIGTIIQDMADGQQDIGVVTEVFSPMIVGAHYTYTIFWVCPRPEGTDYTIGLEYSGAEIKEAFECGYFEIVA